MTISEMMRFIPKVEMDYMKPDDCWQWSASRDGHGYGKFYLDRARIAKLAHRVAYEHWRGTIRHEIDHTCCNKSCVNLPTMSAAQYQVDLVD
jgi:hypothetical protein